MRISKIFRTFAAKSCKDIFCMSKLDKNILAFLVALVAEFAARFGISQDKAYNYIREYKGLEFFFKHYNVLHTLSFADNVDDLVQVCANHGGTLR